MSANSCRIIAALAANVQSLVRSNCNHHTSLPSVALAKRQFRKIQFFIIISACTHSYRYIRRRPHAHRFDLMKWIVNWMWATCNTAISALNCKWKRMSGHVSNIFIFNVPVLICAVDDALYISIVAVAASQQRVRVCVRCSGQRCVQILYFSCGSEFYFYFFFVRSTIFTFIGSNFQMAINHWIFGCACVRAECERITCCRWWHIDASHNDFICSVHFGGSTWFCHFGRTIHLFIFPAAKLLQWPIGMGNSIFLETKIAGEFVDSKRLLFPAQVFDKQKKWSKLKLLCTVGSPIVAICLLTEFRFFFSSSEVQNSRELTRTRRPWP